MSRSNKNATTMCGWPMRMQLWSETDQWECNYTVWLTNEYQFWLGEWWIFKDGVEHVLTLAVQWIHLIQHQKTAHKHAHYQLYHEGIHWHRQCLNCQHLPRGGGMGRFALQSSTQFICLSNYTCKQWEINETAKGWLRGLSDPKSHMTIICYRDRQISWGVQPTVLMAIQTLVRSFSQVTVSSLSDVVVGGHHQPVWTVDMTP